MSVINKKTCFDCHEPLDPQIYKRNSKLCIKCVGKRAKMRGLRRYYTKKYGTVRVSTSIPIELKNFMDKHYIDLRKFLITKLEELKAQKGIANSPEPK